MRWLSIVLLAPALLSCSFGVCDPEFDPLAVEQSGLMLPGGPNDLQIECRGLEPDRCLSMGSSDLPGSISADEPDRVVVSCVGRCNPAGGEMRMDAIVGDEAILIANGGYGEFEQSCSN